MESGRYERIVKKFTLKARSDLCALQQAVLFLALGLATVLTLGKIVEDQIYEGILNGKAILIGAIEALFGFCYLVIVRYHMDRERIWFAFAATLTWFGFAGFYLANSLHRIGAITCLVLGGTQIYGEHCRWRMEKITKDANEIAFYKELEKRIAKIECGFEEMQSERRFWTGSISYWRKRLAR